MKKYRIVYWFNSMITECTVCADCENEAIEKFDKVKGNKDRIIKIEVA